MCIQLQYFLFSTLVCILPICGLLVEHGFLGENL